MDYVGKLNHDLKCLEYVKSKYENLKN